MAARFFSELVRSLIQHKVMDTAAQLAFWAVLALFPFLLFLLTIMGYVPIAGIGQEAIDLVREVMPNQAAQLVEGTLSEILGKEHGWLLVVSLVLALWSASSGMQSAVEALNRACETEETRPWWRRKLLGLAMTIGATASIVVATSAMMIGPNLVKVVLDALEVAGAFPSVWRWLRVPLAAAATLVQLDLLYHFLPDKKMKFRLVSIGSAAAVVMWVVASLGFNLYVARFNSYARTYGALGTPVVLLLWLYLSSFALILGAEINATLARVSRAG